MNNMFPHWHVWGASGSGLLLRELLALILQKLESTPGQKKQPQSMLQKSKKFEIQI